MLRVSFLFFVACLWGTASVSAQLDRYDRISSDMLLSVHTQVTVDVVVLFDISGSMSSQDITYLNEAVRELFVAIQRTPNLEGLRLGIVTFESSSNVVRACAPVKKGETPNTIAGTPGSTDMAGALRQADQLLAQRKHAYPPVVLLLTDGMPNDASATRAAAADLRAKGVQVISFGVASADINFLSSLSDDAYAVNGTNSFNLLFADATMGLQNYMLSAYTLSPSKFTIPNTRGWRKQ